MSPELRLAATRHQLSPCVAEPWSTRGHVQGPEGGGGGLTGNPSWAAVDVSPGKLSLGEAWGEEPAFLPSVLSPSLIQSLSLSLSLSLIPPSSGQVSKILCNILTRSSAAFPLSTTRLAGEPSAPESGGGEETAGPRGKGVLLAAGPFDSDSAGCKLMSPHQWLAASVTRVWLSAV